MKQKSNSMKAEVPESYLQKCLDELLKYKPHIASIRIPDFIFRWLKRVEKCFKSNMFVSNEWIGGLILNSIQNRVFIRIYDALGGKPDTTMMIQVTDKYSLACTVELKTQDKKGGEVGQLHGKQKVEARKVPWLILRSVDEIIETVNQFDKDAEEIKRVLSNEQREV